ncbi:MAG TPA: hypothetical protein VNC50_14850 [Planctomycetia bacterium]|nr:hypothetical protein [Planctomycetia bacterium]
MRHPPRYFAALILSLVAAASAAAQDAVRIKQSGLYRGEIVQYDDQIIKIRLGTGDRTIDFPVEKIETVQTMRLPAQLAAEAALQRSDWQTAAREFRSALSQEKRAWAQQRMQADLVRVYASLGDENAMVETFLEISPHRRDPEILSQMPIRWTLEPPPTAEELARAKSWSEKAKDGAGALIAASWLIDGPESDAARQLLGRLATDVDERVRIIARALQVRERLRRSPNSVKPADLAELRADAAQAAGPLRAGPQFLLAAATEKSAAPADAALAYLKVAFVYGAKGDLAAEALYRGAVAAERGGLQPDAGRLYQELAKSHPSSAAAARAKKDGKI